MYRFPGFRPYILKLIRRILIGRTALQHQYGKEQYAPHRQAVFCSLHCFPSVFRFRSPCHFSELPHNTDYVVRF